MGSSIPARVNGPQLENVKIVECLEVISTEGEPEPMTPLEGDLHIPVFPEVMGQDIPQAFQIGTPARDKSEAIMLHSADHPSAFSPTYFSPNIQSLANSLAVNVPLDAIMLLVPLNPVEVDHMVDKATAPKDLTIDKRVDAHSKKENQIILLPEKVSICAPGHLGPYRPDPNFTRGKKLSTVATKSIPHNTYVDPVQSSIQNNQFVVAKRKVTKRVNRSKPWGQVEKKRPSTATPHKGKGRKEKKSDEK